MSDTASAQFQELVRIMARLRAPDGCPWDREQSFESLKPYLLEEAYEVLDAIDRRDWTDLSEELGDLMLQPVFLAQMASEAGHFNIADSLESINRKLVRRHPHVFGGASAETSEDVKKRWDEIKAVEKESRADKAASQLLLDSVPRALPALVEAQQISTRAARTGFDWESAEQVLDKLKEELHELESARASESHEEIAGELGDILFVIVNLARFLKVDPEQALRQSNAKFRRRFGYVEQRLREQGKTLADSNINEMEALWQQAKATE